MKVVQDEGKEKAKGRGGKEKVSVQTGVGRKRLSGRKSRWGGNGG